MARPERLASTICPTTATVRAAPPTHTIAPQAATERPTLEIIAAPTVNLIAPKRPVQITELTEQTNVTASSVHPPEQTNSFGLVRFDPSNVLDHNPVTSWVEGADGPGIGEHITLEFPTTMTITRLNFDIGFDRDAQIFGANNRVRRVQIAFSDGTITNADFTDQHGMQSVPIEHVATTSIMITIEDVYQDSLYDDTPIAEVQIGDTKAHEPDAPELVFAVSAHGSSGLR